MGLRRGTGASGTLTPTHVYADDGVYTVTLTVTDNYGDSSSDSLQVTVRNLAPAIASFSTDSAGCGGAAENEAVTAALMFEDAGILDAHDVVVDWGDGELMTASVDAASGFRTVALQHRYATGGVYHVSATVVDDSADVDTAETRVAITGVGTVGHTLYVVGTDSDDRVTINQTGNGRFKVHGKFLPDSPREVLATSVLQLYVILCGGNDHVTIASSVAIPAIIDGGFGDDHLKGGTGGNVLLGGGGDDCLIGGKWRDILVGGTGQDDLDGAAEEDVLVGGQSDLESRPVAHQLANDVALLQFLAQWTRTAPRAARESALADFLLSFANDDEADDLTGADAEDWIFAGPEDRIAKECKK